MSELITFPDVEAIVCGFLASALGVPAATSVPHTRPASFVRVMRTGGPRTGIVTEAASITVESWATTEAAAADLAYAARAHMGVLPGVRGGTVVYVVREFSGPANSPDPTSGSPRYVQTFEVVLRGTAA